MRIKLVFVTILAVIISVYACGESSEDDSSDETSTQPAVNDQNNQQTPQTPQVGGQGGRTNNQGNQARAEVVGSLSIEGDAMVIARDGNGWVETSLVDEDGNFNLDIEPGGSYSMAVATGSIVIEDTDASLKMRFLADDDSKVLPFEMEALGISTIPAQLAEDGAEVQVGELVLGSDTATSATLESDSSQVLQSLGISSDEAKIVANGDDNAKILSYFDTNNNGVLDFQEDIYVQIKVHIQWRDEPENTWLPERVKNQFVDLDSMIVPDKIGYQHLSFLVNSEASTATGTMTFPEMKICGTTSEDDENCAITASSKVIERGELNGMSDHEGNGIDGHYFGINAKPLVEGEANPFPSGTYSLAFTNGQTLSFPNFQPRSVASLDQVILAAFRLNVSDENVTSFSYEWKVREKGASVFRTAELNEIKLMFEGSDAAYGIFGFEVDGINEAVSCGIPITSVAGEMTYDDCRVKEGVTVPVAWDKVDWVTAGSLDAYGLFTSYTLRKPD